MPAQSSPLRQTLAATALFGAVSLFVGASVWLLDDLMTRRDRIAEVSLRLEHLSGRLPRRGPQIPDAALRSLFLDGGTMTLAGAALEQRVKEVVEKSGGTVTSSQVELDGAEAKDGYLELTASIEVDQPGLQSILYEIEAGKPYLFVDKLSIQSPEDFGEQDNGRFRMTLALVGQWRPSK